MTLYKADPAQHVRAAEGYLAEKPTEVAAKGREVLEWVEIPGRENHPLDCAVGAMVAASICGVTLSVSGPAKQSKQRRSLRELQEARRR